jgi:quercetin dioxygenase-like cupin family protein
MLHTIFIQDDHVPWEDLGAGVKRKILSYDDKLMMVKVHFAQNAIGPLHQHYHSQITLVQSGSFEVVIGEERKLLGAGDVFYIPPHVMHGCVCKEAGILIDTFSPMREDFVGVAVVENGSATN